MCVAVTKFWIEVADQCRINNNFNAVQEIMSAFTGNAVYRLKPLWEVRFYLRPQTEY